MARPVVWSLYAVLVLIWSSTWVSIKIGLGDLPALLGAGIRFAFAGAVLLGYAALQRRPLRTDRALAALLALGPFATTYGLIYWAEQHVPSGLAAVLFGVLPLYVALGAAMLLPDEPLRPRLLAGVLLAIGGLTLAFRESISLGDDDLAALAAGAVAVSPIFSAAGNIAIKRRGGKLDAVVLNGWAMAAAGVVLLAASALFETWSDARWSAPAIGSVVYLALAGTAFTFVTLTILLRELPAVTVSFISLLLPFGALAFGAALEDEQVTLAAVLGAALVAAGIVAAQGPLRGRPPAWQLGRRRSLGRSPEAGGPDRGSLSGEAAPAEDRLSGAAPEGS